MTNERTFRKQTFINDGRIFEKIVETKASIKRTQEKIEKESKELDYEALKKEETNHIEKITKAFEGVESYYDYKTDTTIWYKNGEKMTDEEVKMLDNF